MKDNLNPEIDEKDLKKALRGFNLGAATPGVGIVWSIVNCCFKKYAIHNLILLGIVWIITFLIFNSYMPWSQYNIGLASLGWLVCFAFWESLTPIPILFIYNGIMGNHWAWKSGKYKTIQEFKKAQNIWNLVGGGITAVVLLSIIFIPMLAINSYNEEQYNMSRQKCILLNESLPPVFNKLGSNFDLEIFANEWGKNNKINHTQAYKAGPQGKDYISISIHNKFIVPHKTGYSYSKLYFVKSSYCEISKGNCYAYMQPESYQKINYICRFYFDDRGKLVPSNSTAKFISGEN